MRIRLWNTSGVARDLAAGRVSEAQSFGYFFACSVLALVNSYAASFLAPEINWLLLYEFFVALAVTLVGVRACYIANEGAVGREFVLRFICISLPVGIKLSLLSWALTVLLYRYPQALLDPFIFVNPQRAWNLFTLLWVAVFTGAYYWRVCVHMRALNQRGIQPNAQADAPPSAGPAA